MYVINLEVSRFLTWKPYNDLSSINEYLNYATKSVSFPDEILLISSNLSFLGTAHILKRDNADIQIGFGLLPEFWNKGFGLKIAISIINYIKNSQWNYKAERILVVIHKDNIYAKKIFIKLNFELNEENVKENFNRYVLKINK